ncbi:MAG: AEC family transporter [Roseinatronobacter sp.]
MILIQTILPIFAIIGLGFVAVRTGYLDRATVAPAGQIVIRIAMPALIFVALASTPIDQALELPFLLAYALGSLAVMGATFALARLALGLTALEASVAALGVSMANSGFMGFPIGQALLGAEDAIRIFAHCLVVENILILPLALLLLALYGPAEAAGIRTRIARDVLRNPLMIALAAGAAFSALGLSLPGPAQSVLEMLTRLSAPLALLVIGGMLATLPVAGRTTSVGLIVLGKLGLHPLAVWLAMALVPGVSPLMAAGGVLFAAMPMITIFPLLAGKAGQGQLAAFGLLAATVTSFATVPLVIHLLGLVPL